MAQLFNKKVSICIPVYNFFISELIENVYNQAIKLESEFEILITDDGSKEEFKQENRAVKKYNQVDYEELKENLGRSKIRNYLSQKAKYENIIFMDCDTLPFKNDFIKQYLKHSETNSVICGGIVYEEILRKKNHSLRWFYGIERESTLAEERSKNPNQSFMTGNFFIKKEVFKKIKFNEKIAGYGHEDTFFGFELEKMNIKIKHIDNQIIHLGLEDNLDFIKKTEQGLINLLKINDLLDDNTIFKQRVKILSVYGKIRKFRMSFLFAFIFKLLRKKIIKNLISEKPSIFLFDLYKILFLCSCK